jgi:hypothetical protein
MTTDGLARKYVPWTFFAYPDGEFRRGERVNRNVRATCTRIAFFLAATPAALVAAGGAQAQQPSVKTQACVDAYGAAQEHRKGNDLLKARASLLTCAARTCPAVVQGDCTTWLAQVVEAIPSIVLEATLDGEHVFDVSVSMDGAAVVQELDGKPIEINPGLHKFTFERKGLEPIEKKMIIAQRYKSLLVSAAWRSPQPQSPALTFAPNGAPAASDSEPDRPVPALAYVLGGVAIAGLGTFAVLGLTGTSTQHDLESSCSPHCSSADVDSLKTRFLAADIAAGVGALSAAGAVVVFLTRPERPAHPRTADSLGIRPLAGGGGAAISGTF